MSNSGKIGRLIKFVSLAERKYATYTREEIMNILGISESTFYRDLKELREVAEIPINYDQKTGGYKIREDYYMKTPELTLSEAMALAVSGNSIFNDIDLPYFKEINMALVKIMAVLPDKTEKLLTMMEDRINISLDSLVDYGQYGDVFNVLSDAIRDEVNVWMKYDPASHKEVTEREVSPYVLDFKNGVLYLYAYCHLREEIRVFRIDRIIEFEITDKEFKYPDEFSIEDYLGNAWGVERGKEEVEIKIKFSGQAVRRVEEHKYHPTQKIKELEDGSVLMTIVTCSTNEVKEWVLGFGAEAEVIEPESLREEIMDEVEKMWGKYMLSEKEVEGC